MVDNESSAREAIRGGLGAIGATSGKAKDVAQGASEWATQIAGTAEEKARDAADKAAARTEQAAVGVVEKARHSTGRASEWGDHAPETIADMARVAGDATQRVSKQANLLAADIGRRTQEQPLAALLVAGALGYTLAYLLHGRR